jgi:4-diphosphocytidyl-2-C-methyl-D-erythritol kinase
LELRTAGFTLECNMPDVPCDDRNLAIKAARKLAETFRVKKGAHIRLQKSIPAGGGMGGGSGNAAVTLRGLDQLWNVNAPSEKLHALAAELGSDVPFFLYDSPAFCRGRGELVQPMRLGVELGVLLINPGFGISTKWAYDQLAAERKTAGAAARAEVPAVDTLLSALSAHDSTAIQRNLFNTLESPCLKKYPLLVVLKEALLQHGALGAMMSGSGSTVFGLTKSRADAAALAERMRAEFGPALWMCATNTVDAPNRNG